MAKIAHIAAQFGGHSIKHGKVGSVEEFPPPS